MTCLDQTPGAHLIYDVRKHHISVFVFQERSLPARLDENSLSPKKLSSNMETWSHGGLRFQKGYVFTRATERGTVHVIRYRVRSADGKWRHKAETVNTPRRKDAERILAERLREVNRGLRLPVETTFAE
jgi:hypothetical protein